jgi:P pilus assembly chaperone PapD
MRALHASALLGLGVLGAFAFSAYRAHAGFALKVTPIPITMSDGATSTMVEVSNESDNPIRVQAMVFDWTMDQNTGQDITTPTGELLVFPSFLTIQPHQPRKVRVGTQGGYAANEKCFRITFGEIPPDFTPADGGADVLNLVAHVSVPVFVKPTGAAGAIKVEALTASKDKVHFIVRNTGTAHAMVERVRLESLGEGGKPLATAETAGWYVLPGQTRPFDVSFVSAGFNCAGAKQLAVTAISRESGTSTAVVDKPVCAAATP